MISQCNIQNYSIYYKDGQLFSYFEYTGDDFEADMSKMAADPKTQEWWDIMMPMQTPLETRAEGEWWAEMEEVFHLDWCKKSKDQEISRLEIHFNISIANLPTPIYIGAIIQWNEQKTV